MKDYSRSVGERLASNSDEYEDGRNRNLKDGGHNGHNGHNDKKGKGGKSSNGDGKGKGKKSKVKTKPKKKTLNPLSIIC